LQSAGELPATGCANSSTASGASPRVRLNGSQAQGASMVAELVGCVGGAPLTLLRHYVEGESGLRCASEPAPGPGTSRFDRRKLPHQALQHAPCDPPTKMGVFYQGSLRLGAARSTVGHLRRRPKEASADHPWGVPSRKAIIVILKLSNSAMVAPFPALWALI
jgi:hypothetical protein